MRNRLAVFLILLMTALPVWAVSIACCHTQPHMQDQRRQHCCEQHTGAHCHDAGNATAADNCQCDRFQHSQFVLNLPHLPQLPAASPPVPDNIYTLLLTERHDIPYRPPIA